MARTTGATGRTVARRRAVSMRGMFFSGSRGANFALASVITTVFSARTFFVVRILFFVAVGAIFERAVALAVIVFMRGVFAVAAFFALASASATVFSARAFFLVRIVRFMTIATAVTRRGAISMRGVFAVAAFFALASTKTTILCARACLWIVFSMTKTTDKTNC